MRGIKPSNSESGTPVIEKVLPTILSLVQGLTQLQSHLSPFVHRQRWSHCTHRRRDPRWVCQYHNTPFLDVHPSGRQSHNRICRQQRINNSDGCDDFVLLVSLTDVDLEDSQDSKGPHGRPEL